MGRGGLGCAAQEVLGSRSRPCRRGGLRGAAAPSRPVSGATRVGPAGVGAWSPRAQTPPPPPHWSTRAARPRPSSSLPRPVTQGHLSASIGQREGGAAASGGGRFLFRPGPPVPFPVTSGRRRWAGGAQPPLPSPGTETPLAAATPGPARPGGSRSVRPVLRGSCQPRCLPVPPGLSALPPLSTARSPRRTPQGPLQPSTAAGGAREWSKSSPPPPSPSFPQPSLCPHGPTAGARSAAGVPGGARRAPPSSGREGLGGAAGPTLGTQRGGSSQAKPPPPPASGRGSPRQQWRCRRGRGERQEEEEASCCSPPFWMPRMSWRR